MTKSSPSSSGQTGFCASRRRRKDVLEALVDVVTADRRRAPGAKISDPEILREYSERLIAKLEERNAELASTNLHLEHEVLERRRAELALSESERRFRDMMENVDLVTIMLGERGQVLFCNEYLLRLSGWTREEVLGRDFFEIFTPSDLRQQSRQAYRALLQVGALDHFVGDILTRGGQRRLISWNITNLRDDTGTVIGMASVGEDVTDRRQVETALRESEARFRELSESLPQLIWTCRADGRATT